MALVVLLGGCGVGVTVRKSVASPPVAPTAAADFAGRPFCGLRPQSYGTSAANAYADALVEENRRFAVFEQLSAGTGTDIDKVKDLLRLERQQMATFIGEVGALPVTADQKPLVDHLVQAKQRHLQILDAQLQMSTIHEMNGEFAALDEASATANAASIELRHALGLPTTRCMYRF